MQPASVSTPGHASIGVDSRAEKKTMHDEAVEKIGGVASTHPVRSDTFWKVIGSHTAKFGGQFHID